MKSPVTAPLPVDWEAGSLEENLAIIDQQGAQITIDGARAIEKRLRADSTTRRNVIAILTRLFSDVRERVKKDRVFGKAVTALYLCTAGETCYTVLANFVAQANAWAMAALTERGDMSELLAEADA